MLGHENKNYLFLEKRILESPADVILFIFTDKLGIYVVAPKVYCAGFRYE